MGLFLERRKIRVAGNPDVISGDVFHGRPGQIRRSGASGDKNWHPIGRSQQHRRFHLLLLDEGLVLRIECHLLERLYLLGRLADLEVGGPLGNHHLRNRAAIVRLQGAVLGWGGRGLINLDFLCRREDTGVERDVAVDNAHRYFVLLNAVGRALFDGHQRILLDDIGAAIGEGYFGDALRHGLHHVIDH